MAKTPQKQEECLEQITLNELASQPSPRQGLGSQRSRIALAHLAHELDPMNEFRVGGPGGLTLAWRDLAPNAAYAARSLGL